jgi:CRISPR-associated endonuclease/helicase Cas3
VVVATLVLDTRLRARGDGMAGDGMVNAALRSVWAKTFWDETERVPRWLPVWQHLDDAGSVAGHLWDRWLPPAVRTSIAKVFGGEQPARQLVRFLAGVHDVGKATPAFAVQAGKVSSRTQLAPMARLTDRMRCAGLAMPVQIPDTDRQLVPHALAGQAILEDWLVERGGWRRADTAQLAVVVGGHHGVPPDHGQTHQARLHEDLMGDGLWRQVQVELVDRAARRCEIEPLIETWGSVRIPQTTQILLTGVLIVADWISSNIELFPLSDLDDQPEEDPDRADRGWRELGLPVPWRPLAEAVRTTETERNDDADERLRQRFGLPEDAEARPVQTAALSAARSMQMPGLLIVEAPMGEGKTEAALLAAEVMAQRCGMGGCLVALPTQATTDAMFERVLDWLRRLPDDVGDLGDDVAHSLALAHGRSWLNDTFRHLRFSGRPLGIAQDEPEPSRPTPRTLPVQAYVDGWTSGRKRGPLADFVVGTVDQLLFVALRARHLALRHLGIARKVVVVDEVHAYDAYMNMYLLRTLEWLGAYGVPVVLLSATLPPTRRVEFHAAYARGRTSDNRPRPTSRVPAWKLAAQSRSAPPEPEAPAGSLPGPYPAVSHSSDGAPVTRSVKASGRRTEVRLETLDDDLPTLEHLLSQRLEHGGCALVVRNTVGRAQQAAAFLQERFGQDVRLVHSRFVGHHRAANDTWLRQAFGPMSPQSSPSGAASTSPRRPPRAIVVGTQVVEQSLDVDFDLLVTDLAPVDLLLQRLGRVHRHRRGQGESDRPARLRRARCVLTGVESWHEAPPEPVRGSAAVYGRHLLYRTAAVVLERLAGDATWRLPEDIGPLVEAVYGEEPLGEPAWQDAMARAKVKADREHSRRCEAAKTFRLAAPGQPGAPILGWLYAGIGEADDSAQGRAQVRDGDDSVEVLLLRRSPEGQLRLPEGRFPYAGEPVPTHQTPDGAVARAIAGCVVRLPSGPTRGARGDELIEYLEQHFWFPEWQKCPALAGQLVLPVDDVPKEPIAGSLFTYDIRTGLEVHRDA